MQECYVCESAQASYATRRKHSKPKRKCSDDLVAIIMDRLQATWSPEQIAHTDTLGVVSFKTIYNWIYAGIIPTITTANLRHKGK